MHSLWTEKYRPQEFSEIAGQQNIIKALKAFVESGQVPHMLLAGPAGSGKSTVALLIAKKLYGNKWRQNFLETNASDERGIDVIRSKIKEFARTRALEYPYKIIFLDEADSLTTEAQNALRRTMETYSEICRFFLSCNYSSRIIEPIQSRCAVFRFKSVPNEQLKNRLLAISKSEGVSIDDSGLDAICILAEGDMRKAINILQTAALSGNIDQHVVYSVVALAEPKAIKELLQNATSGGFANARRILFDLLFKEGIAGEDIIRQMSSVVHDIDLPEEKKIKILGLLGEYEYRINQGGNERIQLEALLAQLTVMR